MRFPGQDNFRVRKWCHHWLVMPPRTQDLSIFLLGQLCPHSHIMSREMRMEHLFWFLLLKHEDTSLGAPNRALSFSLARFDARPLQNQALAEGMEWPSLAWPDWAKQRRGSPALRCGFLCAVVFCGEEWKGAAVPHWLGASVAPILQLRPFGAGIPHLCCLLPSLYLPSQVERPPVILPDPIYIGSLSWSLSSDASLTFHLYVGHCFYSWWDICHLLSPCVLIWCST